MSNAVNDPENKPLADKYWDGFQKLKAANPKINREEYVSGRFKMFPDLAKRFYVFDLPQPYQPPGPTPYEGSHRSWVFDPPTRVDLFPGISQITFERGIAYWELALQVGVILLFLLLGVGLLWVIRDEAAPSKAP